MFPGEEFFGQKNFNCMIIVNRCYMTLTQALTFKLGGSPAGPAGNNFFKSLLDVVFLDFMLVFTI